MDGVIFTKEYASKFKYTRLKSALRARPRGWGLPYQASSIDLPHQSHTLDLALKAPRASSLRTIRSLKKDEIVILGLLKYFILYLPQWQFLDFGIKLEVVIAFKVNFA